MYMSYFNKRPNLFLPQLSSSDESKQSANPLHTDCLVTQFPSSHWNSLVELHGLSESKRNGIMNERITYQGGYIKSAHTKMQHITN